MHSAVIIAKNWDTDQVVRTRSRTDTYVGDYVMVNRAQTIRPDPTFAPCFVSSRQSPWSQESTEGIVPTSLRPRALLYDKYLATCLARIFGSTNCVSKSSWKHDRTV